MVSAKGKIKKTAISEFSRPRSTGLIALTIDPDDELIDVNLTAGNNDILIATRKGKAIRFQEANVRPMGRQARGVTGIRMKGDDAVVGMEVLSNGAGTLLTLTESGLGKRTSVEEYPVKGRGGQGVITIKTTTKSGDVVGIQLVEDSDHLLILTSGGRIIRLRMEEISVIGRNTKGRMLVRMDAGERVVDMARAEPVAEEGLETQAEDEEAGTDTSVTEDNGQAGEE